MRRRPKRTVVVISAVLLLFGLVCLLATASANSGALAEKTLEVDGRSVRFELLRASDGVQACVSFDPDLIHYRQATNKFVPGATPETARRARFEYDHGRDQGRFTMDGGEVVFVHQEDGGWQIEPWVLEIR